jgi:ABC-type dipeptide/oligopeptide/nickel transport system permease subunit
MPDDSPDLGPDLATATVSPVPPGTRPPQAGMSVAAQGLTVEARSQSRMIFERFIHHRIALVSLGFFVALLLFSTVVPVFWKYNYAQITNQFATSPTWQHPFGTDLIGHDLFAQVMTAEATSLKTAVMVAVVSTVIGTVIGALAGYYGKWADALLMRFTDLVLAVPLLAVLLVLANTASKHANSWLWIAIIIAALIWTYLARLVRGSFLSLREREYVEAAHAIGARDSRIIIRHMLPNAIGPIIVNGTLTVANAMLLESFLSFLGLGIQPPEVSLGDLISLGQQDATVLPWLFFIPSGFLIVSILAVNFIGDGLRDAFDPQQRIRQ